MMIPFDPNLDLEITRLLAATPAKVWRCWTEPKLLQQWFAPKPWTTEDAAIDLRAGGRFYTKMASPEGAEFPGEGCLLDVVVGERLVFTDIMEAGFRPAAAPGLGFVAVITMTAEGNGTRYVARTLHKSAEVRNSHAEMGFEVGWGTCADQLGALAASLK